MSKSIDMSKATRKIRDKAPTRAELTKVVIGALALGLGALLGSGSATLFGSDQTSGMSGNWACKREAMRHEHLQKTKRRPEVSGTGSKHEGSSCLFARPGCRRRHWGTELVQGAVPPGHEAGSGPDCDLVRQYGRRRPPVIESAETAILRGHTGLAACTHDSAGSAAARAGGAADLGFRHHCRSHVALTFWSGGKNWKASGRTSMTRPHRCLGFPAKFGRSGHDSGQAAFRFRRGHARPGHHRFRSGERQGHMESRVPPDCFLRIQSGCGKHAKTPCHSSCLPRVHGKGRRAAWSFSKSYSRGMRDA